VTGASKTLTSVALEKWWLEAADPSPAAGACEAQAGGDLAPQERGEVLSSAFS
jgi:hypothetical protein